MFVEHHFADVGKMVEIGSGTQRRLEDLALTHYACYLIAQNGDPTKKPEIAFAQTYFAVQTRKQELIEQRLLDRDRVNAREKLSKTENKLSGIIYERGVDDNNLAVRKILHERGVQPEHLPPAEDVKKVERRIKAADKKALEKPDKIKGLSSGEEE